MNETYYIKDFDLACRGFGFPATVCAHVEDTDDEECDSLFGAVASDGMYLHPIDNDAFGAWRAAGQPRDDESLRRFGAVDAATSAAA